VELNQDGVAIPSAGNSSRENPAGAAIWRDVAAPVSFEALREPSLIGAGV
jgi:hypothetical protein